MSGLVVLVVSAVVFPELTDAVGESWRWFGKRETFQSAVSESKPLLDYLYARATRHENIYRHKWQVGDVLMWDNRCAMHYAVRDYDDGQIRYLHRTTAAGDRPI